MRKKNINLRILFFILLSIVMIKTNAQTGLNFQGVARTSNNVILASQAITIKLSILQGSSTGTADYVETRRVITNAQGLFTAVIGDTGAISTLGNFTTINWKLSPKFLKIEMDPAAGNNFMTMGTTQFQYVAYAQFAKSVDAENIVGIVPVTLGGTGVNSLTGLKTALTLNKVNNTSDADKIISTLTQTALDLKSNAADTSKFTKQTYSDSSLLTKLKISDTSAMLSSRIARDTLNLSNRINLKAYTTDLSLGLELKASSLELTSGLATKVDKVAGKNLSTNDYSNTEKTKLEGIAGTNTGDQDLSLLATTASVVLKANSTDVTSGLALKENISNKSTAVDLGGTSPSDVLFPTQKAVKEYIAANNAGGGVADGGITNIKLADGAVTYAKFQSIPTNTILGNTSSSTTSVQAITTTGSDNVVLATSPTITSPILITPNIGVATATSINDVIINGFNFKSHVPSLTITGTTTLQGNNTGDNATNTKYEGLLTYGAVDLITNQAIDGKKTFLNDITMANLLGVGSITPTTINFANGSKIGDIQNINEDNPDADGSIDLYAPDGAKWVQLNYDDINYIGLGSNRAFIQVGGEYWKFNKNGTTDLPGDLNFTDNHAINFTSTGTSTPTTNASITSTGPYLKLATRAATEDELDEPWNPNGVELNYADRNKIELREIMNFINQDDDDRNEDYWSTASFIYDNFNFLINNNGSYYQWQFKDDGSTVLPGALLLTGNIETTGTLKLGSTTFTNQSTTNGYVLTYNNGNAVWQAPTGTSVSDNIDANTLSGTTLKSTITGSSLTSVGTLVSGLIPYSLLNGTVPTWNQNTTGNAATATTATTAGTATTATKLSTARNINGVAFDGSEDITITASADAGTLTGTTLKSTNTGSSLTSLGTLANLTVTDAIVGSITGNAATATTASTATKLATARNINGVTFDGSQDITITASADAGTLTGTSLKSTITGSSLTSVGTIANLTTGAIINSGKLIVGATSAASSSAVLEASSTTQGFLPPRLNYYQRTQIATPIPGLTIWCSNCGASGEMQVFNGASWTNMIGGTATGTISLSIGANYQGGKIAYIFVDGDPGYDANTQHGLIAATSDQSTGIQWYNGEFQNTGATGSAIGTGLSNTNTIIKSQGGTSTDYDYAAVLARTYNGGGYTDWYLPSKDELNKLYLQRIAIGGFTTNNYWTSSEVSYTSATTQDFFSDTSVWSNIMKYATTVYVRAVRSF